MRMASLPGKQTNQRRLAFAVGLWLSVLSVPICAADVPSISVTLENAVTRAGAWVMFEGVVSDVGQAEGGSVFLNFGGKYPDHVLTVFVPPFLAHMTRPESWQAYKGKRVQVDGIVNMHKGKPEIELKQMNFLRLRW